ncbi:hypothetical protein KI387_009091, partial [Taxus chinensis]
MDFAWQIGNDICCPHEDRDSQSVDSQHKPAGVPANSQSVDSQSKPTRVPANYNSFSILRPVQCKELI